MTAPNYTDPDLVLVVKTTPAPRYGRSASGYGGKIPTTRMIHYLGRWRRVYVMQYANAGSAYIIVNGQDLFLDGDTEYRIEHRNALEGSR